MPSASGLLLQRKGRPRGRDTARKRSGPFLWWVVGRGGASKPWLWVRLYSQKKVFRTSAALQPFGHSVIWGEARAGDAVGERGAAFCGPCSIPGGRRRDEGILSPSGSSVVLYPQLWLREPISQYCHMIKKSVSYISHPLECLWLHGACLFAFWPLAVASQDFCQLLTSLVMLKPIQTTYLLVNKESHTNVINFSCWLIYYTSGPGFLCCVTRAFAGRIKWTSLGLSLEVITEIWIRID